MHIKVPCDLLPSGNRSITANMNFIHKGNFVLQTSLGLHCNADGGWWHSSADIRCWIKEAAHWAVFKRVSEKKRQNLRFLFSETGVIKTPIWNKINTSIIAHLLLLWEWIKEDIWENGQNTAEDSNKKKEERPIGYHTQKPTGHTVCCMS